jgi:hypothetical protein
MQQLYATTGILSFGGLAKGEESLINPRVNPFA